MAERTATPELATGDATAPVAEVAPDHSSRNTLVIALLLTSTFVVILNETIMGVALPRLMHDLSITASAAQWLTTAFLLTMAVVIPISGFLLQRFNTRPVFLTAMGLFSAGTLISASAPGFTILLVGRVVQAGGTAIMMPLLMTTILTLVPIASRGKVMGNVSIVMSVAPAIGPTISGLILSVLEWRWMFWLVLPIAVAALVLGAFKIQNVTTPRKIPIDVLSVVLSAFAFGGLVYGLSSLGESAHTGILPSVIALSIGVVALAVFILRQLNLQKFDRALLDLRTFLSKTFTVSIAMLSLSMMTLFGTLILLPIYVQTVLGFDPLATGLMLLPGGLLMGLLAPFVGRIYDRRGPRVLLVPGAVIISAAFWTMTLLTASTPFIAVLGVHIFLSIGLGLTFTPLFTAGLGSVRPDLYSHGSAIVGTVQQLAGAAGTALFITIMTSQTANLVASGSAQTAAVAGGIHSAFTWGAAISMLAIVAAFFIKPPAAQPGAPAPIAAH
ncbi:MDR family MFS transporter [Plantibacter sp. Mn2098]|uniref:MDR family MFS transporter n=1 Tax=Plantibacter sp. Mn2098 TaxID=3395266 RepID=UPI003BEB5E7A